MREGLTTTADFGATTSKYNRIEFVVRQIMNRIATATLVRVEAVDTDTVDIRPMVAQIDGAGNAVDHGTIHNAPFFMPRAGASAVMIKPVVGDIGLAIFCHNDISAVKSTKAPANPGSRRRYDWSDALYLGGFLGDTPTQYIRLDENGVAITATDGKPIALTSTDKVDVAGPVDSDTEYRVGGIKVVGEQQAAITAPTGGSTTDAQSRTAINAIILALQAHGLIA